MAKFRYEIYQLVKGKNIDKMNQEERNAQTEKMAKIKKDKPKYMD